MLKLIAAVAASAIIAGILTLPPAVEPVQAKSAMEPQTTVALNPVCERAWPYPRCSANGQVPVQNIRIVTTDRILDLRPIQEASVR
ncbi:MAG TPA: hypothetical protein VFB45_12600 [Pseudolabrys sp.]|nr:hypothetical protein [Pseudolabrys sp.]